MLVLQILGKNIAWTETEYLWPKKKRLNGFTASLRKHHMNCMNQKSAYEEWKCQTLKGSIWSWYFPFPQEPNAFPEQNIQPHIHTSMCCTCTSVYSRERRLQSLGRAEVPWDRRCATAWRQPLPHSVYDLSKLGLQFTELKYMWPSDFPKLVEEACNGPENGLHVCQIWV